LIAAGGGRAEGGHDLDPSFESLRHAAFPPVADGNDEPLAVVGSAWQPLCPARSRRDGISGHRTV
jgi:hypothetical protein